MTKTRTILVLCLLTQCSGRLAQTAVATGGLSFALSGSSSIELLAWAKKAGIESAKLAPGDELAVRGLLALQNITPGSAVVTMTREDSLIVIHKQKTPFPKLVPADIWDSCSQHMQLALLLLKEVKKGPASKFHPWIQTLPTTFDSLKYWSKTELDQLQTGTMPGEQLKAQVEQQWSDTKKDILAVQNASIIAQLHITHEDLIWANEIVISRSFAGPTRIGFFNALGLGLTAMVATVLFRLPFVNSWKHSPQAAYYTWVGFVACMMAVWLQQLWGKEGDFEMSLLPVIDLINHRSTGQGCMEASRLSNTIKCVVYEGFNEGDEVCHSYGEKNNEDLLSFYGFVEENNLHDYYTADLMQYLNSQNDISADWVETFESSSHAANLKKAQLRAEGWSDLSLKSLRAAFEPVLGAGLQVEQRVFEVLQDFCNEAIASKPTTLQADIAELQSLQHGTGNDARRNAAVQFKISTKKLLHKCALQYDSSQAQTPESVR